MTRTIIRNHSTTNTPSRDSRRVAGPCRFVARLRLVCVTLWCLARSGVCVVGDQLSRKHPAWVGYRLGDVFKGEYPKKSAPTMPKGSIAWAYARRSKKQADLGALNEAALEICSEILGLDDLDTTNPTVNGSTAAFHLRLGDVLLMQERQMYLRFAPPEFYYLIGHHLVQAGVKTAVLFYHPGFRVSARHKAAVIEMSEQYARKVTEALAEFGIKTVRASLGHADTHFCLMLAAEIFVPSGGGYSKLVQMVRQERGANADLPYRWWCTISGFESDAPLPSSHWEITASQLRASRSMCKKRTP